LRQLSNLLGVEIGEDLLDKPLPDLGDVHAVKGHQSRFQVITELARRDELTVRQLLTRLGGGRGHRTFTGTPEQIANTLQEWFESGAADGFNVMPPLLPSGLADFVDHVVPILRQRGLFRSEYTGTTLRDHYGLSRPRNRYSSAIAESRAS
jgi:alkanesulfonate monooxygenase SsuD/methylene tetrahydromethanopterin reductase-like flavin-dependent oxidoreductase (luciferase family)